MKNKLRFSLQLLVFSLLFAGCSTSTIQVGNLRAHNTRWFWSSTDFVGQITDTNGVSATFALKSSNVQSDAIAAAAEGVARGLAASQGR